MGSSHAGIYIYLIKAFIRFVMLSLTSLVKHLVQELLMNAAFLALFIFKQLQL